MTGHLDRRGGLTRESVVAKKSMRSNREAPTQHSFALL